MTDGVRIYFSEYSGGNIDQVSITGGETSHIATPFANLVIQDISPNRSELLVLPFSGTEAEDPFWLVPLPSGAPRRIGNIQGHSGVISPDGQQILYANGSALFLAKLDGS